MPHECTDCGRAFEDGSKEMLSGCPDCGGTTFQFRPDGPGPSEETDDTPEPPGPDVDGVARTVGNAASTVRNLVAGGRRSDDDPDPGVGPADDSRAGDAGPEHDRSGTTADAGGGADTSTDSGHSRQAGCAVDTGTVDTDDTSDGEADASGGAETTEEAETTREAETTGGVEATEEAETTDGVEATEEAETTDGVEATEKAEAAREPEATGGVETPEAIADSDTTGEGTSDGTGQSGASADVDSTDEADGLDPMEADWPGTDTATDDGQHRNTASPDSARPDTGDGIVEADEQPSEPRNSRDRPPVPDPRPLSARSGDSEKPETDEGSRDDESADVAGEGSGERPSLSELRAELNDQFESIRVVAPGQYELNLMELYDRQEYIIALQEDGKYTVQIPDSWE